MVRLYLESGQTLAEYGILVSVIATIVVVAALLFGHSVSTLVSGDAQNV
jgi:Flp pilus assembly pilin Flp